MLHRLDELIGYTLSATDGEIGKSKDFLFEDRPWTVRYLVADTRTWLPGRKVLIPLIALQTPDRSSQQLNVNLTVQQIKDSPPQSEDEPVSRQHETITFLYYGWPAYWAERADTGDPKESFLRSVREIIGYFVQTPEGGVARLRSLIFDDEIWAIRYLVCEIKKEEREKSVLIAPEWVDSVNWLRKSIMISLPQDLIDSCPAYDHSRAITRSEEAILYNHFGRKHYW